MHSRHTISSELHRIFDTDADDPQRVEKWMARIDPADAERVRQQMEEGFRSGEVEFEYRYRHPSLGVRWLYCKGRRLREDAP